jgi:hypothetical protein
LKTNSFFVTTIQKSIRGKLPPLKKSRRSNGKRASRLQLRQVAIPSAVLGRLTSILFRTMYPHMRKLSAAIPASAIRNMKTNYSEVLPKTMRLLTADLNHPRSKAAQAASSVGLIDLLNSDEIHSLGEMASGKKLARPPDCQIICYENGDFTGPHTDHHPENESAKSGFVDVHVMLSERSVLSQLLVYEARPGLLNEVHEVGRGMALAVYHLPFWHYTTPLRPRSSKTKARRWLLLASFDIERRSA